MTLDTLQKLFETIQDETELKNLMEHKFNLSIEVGKLHMLLHDGNASADRSHTLASINAASTLETIINDKIQLIKQSEIEARRKSNIESQKESQREKRDFKRYNIEESNLAVAAKKLLNRSTYMAIVKVAQEMPHRDIRKLKQKDLPMLILSVRDEDQTQE